MCDGNKKPRYFLCYKVHAIGSTTPAEMEHTLCLPMLKIQKVNIFIWKTPNVKSLEGWQNLDFLKHKTILERLLII